MGNLAVTTKKMGGFCHMRKWASKVVGHTMPENADLASNHMLTVYSFLGLQLFPMVTEI